MRGRRPHRIPPWNRAAPDPAFLAAVREGRLPEGAWTHRRFLRLAFLVLREQGRGDAPGHLHALVPDQGHTSTYAWVQVLAGAGAEHYLGDFRDFLADHPGFIDPGYLRRHYSAALLAREAIVEPDRDPLPRPGALLPDAPGARSWWAELWAWLRGEPVEAAPEPLRLVVRSQADTACPYCADPLDLGEVVSCRRCDTLHHHDCWRDGGGCTTFGCGAGPEQRRRA
jgi:hypothetical protein